MNKTNMNDVLPIDQELKLPPNPSECVPMVFDWADLIEVVKTADEDCSDCD